MIQGEQVQDSELSTQAVIYLGPSSMSLMVAEAVRDRIRLLDFLQQPVPMARDIFRFHRISRHTMDRCVQIIGDYLEILKEYGAGSKLSVRFMISNIISEADNVDVFVNRMHVAHGLRGRRIDDGKMTRLIYVKVQEALAQYPGFSKKKVLVVHTGPGNTRVLLFQKGRIVRYSCYRLGTHRTGEAVGEIEYGDDVAELSILREHMRGQVDQICLDYGGVKGLAGRCLGIAGHPVDAPMWFLRDIIIYTAAAPLLYRLGDYLLWAGMVMLSLNYFALDLADHDYPIANSLGFFLLGMYVSRYSLPFLTESVRRYAVPFLVATLALTWWLAGHRDQHNSMLIALGMLGLMSLAILFTEWFPRAARWVAELAPACFFIFGTHYIVIILLRESGWITWKGAAWDMLWLFLVPVIFAVLAGLFFCMKRFAPRLVPLLGAYGK